jgi:TPR repeat protein
LYFNGEYVELPSSEGEAGATLKIEYIQDYTKAFNYYYQAAYKGYAAAQNNLGFCYYHGYGLPEGECNTELAIYWYETSAKQGYPPAIDNLKTVYANTSRNGSCCNSGNNSQSSSMYNITAEEHDCTTAPSNR